MRETYTETFLIDLVQGRSSVPSAWLWGYEGVEYEGTVARLSRVYQPAVSVLSDVRVVVDVRAGVGVASACFRTLHPEAAIHCFEVDPLALHLLRQNILSLGNCFVHSVGLAGQNSCRTCRLWPEDPQAEWGVEQLLPFREARAALKELGLEFIDVLRVATGGEEVEGPACKSSSKISRSSMWSFAQNKTANRLIRCWTLPISSGREKL